MTLKNTPQAYGWVSITIHWLMAIAIFAMFGLGLWMTGLGYYDSWYHKAPDLHKSIGMLLLFMLLFRLFWRLLNSRPQLLGAPWEQSVALAVHRSHYLLLFAVTVTGYLIPTAAGVGIDLFGWFTVPATLSFPREQAGSDRPEPPLYRLGRDRARRPACRCGTETPFCRQG